MNAEERLLEYGYEDIKIFVNYNYDDALIGVSEDGRAVYDYNKICDWLMKKEGWSYEEAVEWIDYNVLRSLPYMGNDAPIIMYSID